MNDQECVHFLQWALPQLHMRWKGFRKVRRQVCRRISKRMAELNISSPGQYREYLAQNPDEWLVLDRMCRITISRFYRNRGVFDYLARDVLPELIRHVRSQGCSLLRVWSCGSASGEEPYTIALTWHSMFREHNPDMDLEIVATDIDPVMIQRAQTACYKKSSLRNLPAVWLAEAFVRNGEEFCLKKYVKDYVRYKQFDIRAGSPDGYFHIVLCRNLAFTYFAPELQQKVLHTICDTMESQGILITGSHETPALEGTTLSILANHMPVYRKT